MRPPSLAHYLFIAFTGLSLLSGCTESTSLTQASTPTASPVPAAAPVPVVAEPSPPDAASLLAEAEAQGTQATLLAQSAQSLDDWDLVATRWEQAIALLERIPDNTPQTAAARQRITEYQQSLATAQTQANRPVTTTAVRLNRPEPEAPAPEAAAPPEESAETTAAVADPNLTPEVALATHLSQSGARMYAAYWCGYCRRQQELFGADAAQQLEIVECDPRGTNPQVDRCRAANVASFPTWEINGQIYRGMQSLNQLADASGYQGSRSFRN